MSSKFILKLKKVPRTKQNYSIILTNGSNKVIWYIGWILTKNKKQFLYCSFSGIKWVLSASKNILVNNWKLHSLLNKILLNFLPYIK